MKQYEKYHLNGTTEEQEVGALHLVYDMGDYGLAPTQAIQVARKMNAPESFYSKIYTVLKEWGVL